MGCNMSREHILVVDDEQGMLQVLEKLLTGHGYRVSLAGDGQGALETVGRKIPDLILADIKMPIMDGMIFLEEVKKVAPQIPVIMMTGFGAIETAVRAMKLGAYDYINKPFDIDEILMVIDKALEKKRLEEENFVLRRELQRSYTFKDIISRNKEMGGIFEVIKSLSGSQSTALVVGETGTGKELVARAIHDLRCHNEKPFVPVDCGAFSTALLESELFGHVKGSFPGADRDKPGLFEAAMGGTVFLDQIGNVSSDIQARLLRVLEDRAIKRFGDTQARDVNFCLIAAANEDLEAAVNDGRFRKDLYYRLNVVAIDLPPLRKRKEDIPLLVDHFINKFNRLERKAIECASEDVINIMMRYDWPGNVRELENLIHHAVVVKKTSVIHPKDLPAKMGVIVTAEQRGDISRATDFNEAKQQAVASFEKRYLIEALKQYSGNVSKVASAIGLDRRNLQRKFKQYRIAPKDFVPKKGPTPF